MVTDRVGRILISPSYFPTRNAGVLKCFLFLRRFEYNPDSLRVVLFPTNSNKPRARSRTPVDNTDTAMDIDDAPATTADPAPAETKPPSVFAHTRTETFLIYPQIALTSSPADPSSSSSSSDSAEGSTVLRYTIAVVSRTQLSTGTSTSSQESEDTAASMAVDASAPATSSPAPHSVSAGVPGPSEPAPPSDTSKSSEAAEPLKVPTSKEQSQSPDDGMADMSMSPSEAPKTPVKESSEKQEQPEGSAGEKISVEKVPDGKADENAKDEDKESTVRSEEATPTAEVKAATSEGGVAEDVKKGEAEPEAAPVSTTSASTEKDGDKPTEQSSANEVESPATRPSPPPPKQEYLTTLQVLQRDLTPEQFVFDVDGVGVVSNDVEDGVRKGWKMEVRSWRLAGAEASSLIRTVV